MESSEPSFWCVKRDKSLHRLMPGVNLGQLSLRSKDVSNLTSDFRIQMAHYTAIFMACDSPIDLQWLGKDDVGLTFPPIIITWESE